MGKRTWAVWASAALAAGCVPREEGIAAAAWADTGDTFLGVLVSYVPGHTMFGLSESRGSPRVHFFEQSPVREGRTPLGPDVDADVMGFAYYMKSAGYLLYFAGGFDGVNHVADEHASWRERALPSGAETVVASPADRPKGCHETQVVPSRDGQRLALLHAQCDPEVPCQVEIRERATRTTVFTHRWACTGWTPAWQPNGDLVLDGEVGGASALRVVAPNWDLIPFDAAADWCREPSSSGRVDGQGQVLSFSHYSAEVTVMAGGEKPTGCDAP